MSLNPTTILSSVLNWLRAGYPDGVPQEDYVALLAVLRRRLTEAEVLAVVETLTAERKPGEPIDRDAICAAIQELSLQQAGDDDIDRVRARLAAAGWSLADTSDA